MNAVGVIGQLKDYVTGRRGKPQRAQILSARPVRNPAVEWDRQARGDENEGTALVVLRIPRRTDRLGNAVARLFQLPAFRKVELDAIGSDVWEMCDGVASVEAITKAVCAQYRLNRRQGEASVTAYLRMLAERRLVGLRPASAAKPAAGVQERASDRRGVGRGRRMGNWQ